MGEGKGHRGSSGEGTPRHAEMGRNYGQFSIVTWIKIIVRKGINKERWLPIHSYPDAREFPPEVVRVTL